MNKTQLYMIVKSEFMEKKAKAESIAYQNLQNAKKNPEFNQLFRKERALIFEIAKNKSQNISDKSLIKELEEVKKQKLAVLKSMNIDQSSLLPKYSCNTCNDTGVISNGRPCDCFTKVLKERLIKQSSMPLSSLHDFTEFNEKIAKNTEHQEQLAKLKKTMQDWIDSKNINRPALISLSGNTGVGKTFLTECTATYALKKGWLVSLISAFGMNNLFLKYHTSKSEDKTSVLDSLLDPDLLIIDDLGTEPLLKNVTIEYLYVVIAERLLQNKSTLITTNLDSSNILARYGERIFSRMFNKRQCRNIFIKGDDLRTNK